MKPFAFVAIAVVAFSLAGCKPDAALKRGEVIDAGPSASDKDVKKSGQPVVIEPKTDKENPVKQVQ
jgi:hypothetical protein